MFHAIARHVARITGTIHRSFFAVRCTAPNLTLTHDFSSIRLGAPGGCIDPTDHHIINVIICPQLVVDNLVLLSVLSQC